MVPILPSFQFERTLNKIRFLGYQISIPVLFFAVLLVIGTAVFRDYGVDVDETDNQIYAQCTLEAFSNPFSKQPYSDCSVWKDMSDKNHQITHTPALLASELLLERSLGIKTPRQAILLKHVFSFFIFWLAVVSLYFISHRFLSPAYRLLPSFFLVICPRLFGASFYLYVDVWALSFFIFGILTLIRFIEKPSRSRFIWHCIVSGFGLGVRLTGLIVTAITLGVGVIESIHKKNKRAMPPFRMVLYSASVFLVLFLIWPLLWSGPIQKLSAAIYSTAAFHKNLHFGPYLYFGQWLKGFSPPWHYNLISMLLTLPPITILFFGPGVYFSLKTLPRFENILLFTWFFVPLILAVILKTTLYDGWRHFYFIYPAFALFSAIGFEKVHSKMNQWGARFLIGLMTVGLLWTLKFMVVSHPYEGTYYNLFVGGMKGAFGRFPLDERGISFREGLQRIAEASKPAGDILVNVYMYTRLASDELHLLNPDSLSERVKFVDESKAEFFMTNLTRTVPINWAQHALVFSIDVEGTPILKVYRRTNLQI